MALGAFWGGGPPRRTHGRLRVGARRPLETARLVAPDAEKGTAVGEHRSRFGLGVE